MSDLNLRDIVGPYLYENLTLIIIRLAVEVVDNLYQEDLFNKVLEGKGHTSGFKSLLNLSVTNEE